MRSPLFFIYLLLLTVTWILSLLHLGVYPRPELHPLSEARDTASWLPRSEFGINHLIVSGSAFERGRRGGELTASLIERQEAELVTRLEGLIPSTFLRGGFLLFLMRWFYGIEKWIEPEAEEEMLGISLSGSPRWNHYADPFTRQVAYHGLHEVGQLMVDINPEAFGCTVFAVPVSGGWAIGRNFDFEAGRIFDEEKVLKWVFPETGFAFVSVSWAGMVGVVTGVNERGVYLSLNAAGSTHFRRYGTPSTLVALKALQYASTAEEARRIIESSRMFIADIFVVADKTSALRIEKSAQRVHSSWLKDRTAITNHLLGPPWTEDKINIFRRDELTSEARLLRAKTAVERIGVEPFTDIDQTLLRLLRDKSGPLGHRSSIDALIATHSVIYNGPRQSLYVGEGPSLVGRFRGYDLRESFRSRRPVELAMLPRDPSLTLADYQAFQHSEATLTEVRRLLKKRECQAAYTALEGIALTDGVPYFITQGEVLSCLGKRDEAKTAFLKARFLQPPYLAERRKLEEELSK